MFSVVITTHNRLAFLKKAIASALGQTVACEIIVVDDLATDGTEQYCRGLGEKIVYLRNMSNLGQSASVNRGIQAAKGEWIKHLDDDDYMYANCIEEYENAIKCSTAAVLCNCLSTIVSENGDTVGREGEVFRTRQDILSVRRRKNASRCDGPCKYWAYFVHSRETRYCLESRRMVEIRDVQR